MGSSPAAPEREDIFEPRPLPPLPEDRGDSPGVPHRSPIIEALDGSAHWPGTTAEGLGHGVAAHRAAETDCGRGEGCSGWGRLHRSIRVYISGRFYLIVPTKPLEGDAGGSVAWCDAVLIDRQARRIESVDEARGRELQARASDVIVAMGTLGSVPRPSPCARTPAAPAAAARRAAAPPRRADSPSPPRAAAGLRSWSWRRTLCSSCARSASRRSHRCPAPPRPTAPPPHRSPS